MRQNLQSYNSDTHTHSHIFAYSQLLYKTELVLCLLPHTVEIKFRTVPLYYNLYTLTPYLLFSWAFHIFPLYTPILTHVLSNSVLPGCHKLQTKHIFYSVVDESFKCILSFRKNCKFICLFYK